MSRLFTSANSLVVARRGAATRLGLVMPSRSLVYTRDGVLKARGMKKDESEYLTSSTGIAYPGDKATLEPIKTFLGEEYTLPDDLILQVLTHKSFAHGKKPFNERLANLGRDFLRLHTFGFAVSHKPSASSHAVGEFNFDIEPRILELMSSTTVLSQIARQLGVEKSLFWKNPYPTQSPERNGENTVCAKSISAAVAAVLLHHGEAKAHAFVKSRLLSGPYSVLPIVEKVYVPKKN
ncbi:large ribosomal subunit protein mL57 [Trichomonascus vanleenenianus]|uniref:mitochondrial 54S ribosomal protein mL57 MRPL15 n=1 Tax=Trichomonascus vanleenenianus TaxID=2268995 RepID=UPI003EC9AA72